MNKDTRQARGKRESEGIGGVLMAVPVCKSSRHIRLNSCVAESSYKLEFAYPKTGNFLLPPYPLKSLYGSIL